jgi:CheY-like chemotaxis protein
MLLEETKYITIFLADDDPDDCSLFQEALNELSMETLLTITNDGVELMTTLDDTVPPPPYVIFLDLNMPRKNGFDALKEIRSIEKLKDIPVVIFSTTSHAETVERTFRLGANYYICKPNSFFLLMKAIERVLSLERKQLEKQPTRNQFVMVV